MDAKQGQKAFLQGGTQNFVSCSNGWQETETPEFFYCASKKKYEFCKSFELERKKCNTYGGVKSGGDWVEFDLGKNHYRQMIFTTQTIFEDESTAAEDFVPFYEEHNLSVKDGDFKIEWERNDSEIKLSFSIDGELYTVAGLKTLDAKIEVKTFAKNLSGGTKIWYEIKNLPSEFSDRLEFIKMSFAPQEGFAKEEIKKVESSQKIEAAFPEGLSLDLTDLQSSGYDISFENNYTLIIRAPQGGWDEKILLDPVFQSSGPSEDVWISGTNGHSSRTYIKFNISSIPVGSTINSATLQLYIIDSSDDNDYTFYHIDQNQGWGESDSYSNIWGMHIGSFQSVTNCFAGTGDQNCAITDVFQAAYNAGDSNFSFRMEDPDQNSNTLINQINNDVNLQTGRPSQSVYKRFSSTEGTKAPILFVDYTLGNSAPDINVTRIDTYADNAALPIFGYSRDGNLTIDFNIQDPNNDRLTIDINYSTTNTQGSGTPLYTDLNLTTTAPSNCDDQNFTDTTECSIDLNISNITDNNYYILIRIEDSSANDFNASDNSFKIDNTVPTLSGALPLGSATTTDTTPDLNVAFTEINAWYCTARAFVNGVAQSDVNSTLGLGRCLFSQEAALSANDTILVQFKMFDLARNSSSDLNSGTYTIFSNSSPDINVTRIDTYADNAALPIFGYSRDGNLTIDFNIQDPDNDRLTIDINYSTTNTQGSGTPLYTDLNLTTTAPSNCDDQNFTDTTECSIDLNISNITDNNYYILIRIEDSSANDFNASDNSFKIDNNAPSVASFLVSSFSGQTGYTNDTTPLFAVTAVDANGMAFSCDGTTYSSFVAYDTTYSSFNVNTGEGCTDSDGNKTVYIKVRDLAGNSSSASSASSFVIDTNSPLLHGALPVSADTTSDTTPTFSTKRTETNFWYCIVTPIIDGVEEVDQNVVATPCTYTQSDALTVGQTMKVRFGVKDLAGNDSNITTGTYTLVAPGTGTSPGTGGTGSGGVVCGDRVCHLTSGETCGNCAVDCGLCAGCGNGTCDLGETFYSCDRDCPLPSHMCSELGGIICEGIEKCSGNLLNATDSAKCCFRACVAQPDLTAHVYADAIVSRGGTGNVVVTISNLGGNSQAFDVELKEVAGSAVSKKTVLRTAGQTIFNEPKDVFLQSTSDGAPSQRSIGGMLFSSIKTMQGLGKENSVSIIFPINFDKRSELMTGWEHTVRQFVVTVDSANAVVENDESNNQKTVSIYFGGDEICSNRLDDNNNGEVDENCGVPDLAIKGISSSSASYAKKGVALFTFDVTVEAKYACARNVKLGMFKDGQTDSLPLATSVVGEICPGKEKIFSIKYTTDGLLEAGSIIQLQRAVPDQISLPQISFVIDPDGTIDETDETNNSAFTVPELPDLKIVSVDSPQTVFFGGAIEISALIKNDSTVDSQGFEIALFLNNSEIAQQSFGIPAILAGEEQVVTFSLDSATLATSGDLPMQIRFLIRLDSLDEVLETSEFNNEEDGAFDIVELESYFYNPIVLGENFLLGLWLDKGENLNDYTFSFDGVPMLVLETSVHSEFSAQKDFVIFMLDTQGLPLGLNSFVGSKGALTVATGSFLVNAMSLEEIYYRANDTSVMLKVGPNHLKLIHFERMRQLNNLWWIGWFFGI